MGTLAQSTKDSYVLFRAFNCYSGKLRPITSFVRALPHRGRSSPKAARVKQQIVRLISTLLG